MKKLALFAVVGLFLSVTAFANIVVLQDGRMTSYEPGSNVVIKGKTTSRVLYDGVLITIPRGQKVQISKKDGQILVFGVNLRGVEIAGKQVSSEGQAMFAVSPETMQVSSIRGNTTIVSNEVIFDGSKNTGNINKVVNKPGTVVVKSGPVSQAPVQTQVSEPVVFPEVSEYVNEVVTEQASQDVERPDMSQSTTTGA